MSGEEDYSHNIDDQLFKAVKNEVGVDQGNDLNMQRLHSNSQLHHNQHNQHQSLQSLQHPQMVNHALQQQQQQQMHQLQQQHHMQHQQHHQQHHSQSQMQHPQEMHQQMHHHTDFPEAEYPIAIPEPLITSKSKIYPVQENTITTEGNLITKPYRDQDFSTRKELNDFIADFARENGFGVVIAHSNKKAIYYTCELGGRYRDKKNKKASTPYTDDNYLLDPNTKTKKLRCPFAMTASYKKTQNVWSLKVTCNEHNHPQLDPLSNHPMLRKRSSELNLLIVELYKVGTKPSHIENKIKEQYPDILIKREDIYNEIRGYKRKLKRDNGYLNNNSDDRFAKRSNANSFHQVGLPDDDDDSNNNLYQHRNNDVDLERLQQAAAAAVQQHQNSQPAGLDDQYSNDNAVAAMQVVNSNHNDQISMDNIDSRLVGE